MHSENTSKANGRATASILISVEAPRPYLDEGEYVARCTDATIAWSKRWSKWVVRIVLEPINYYKPYTGELCRFLYAGKKPAMPHITSASQLYRLLVEANGAPLVNSQIDLSIFRGRFFQIRVATVKQKSDKSHTDIDQCHWYSTVRDIALTHEPTQPTNPSNPHNPQNPHNTINPSNPDNPRNLLTYQPTQPIPKPSNTLNLSNPLTQGFPDEEFGVVMETEPYEFDLDENDCTPRISNKGSESQRSKGAATPRSQNAKRKKH